MTLEEIERQYRLPPGVLSAVQAVESGGNVNAVSPKGAVGPFQFMPATAQQYGIDPRNPDQAAHGAARMLADLSSKYQGDLPRMLAGYNWGQGNVDRKGLDNAPAETRNYIQKVSGKMEADPSASMDWLRRRGLVDPPSTQSGDASPDTSNSMDWLRSRGLIDAPTKQEPQNTRSMASVPAAGFNRGVLTGLPGLPMDTAVNAWDLLKAGAGYAGHELFGMTPPGLTDRSKVVGSSEWLANKIRDAGGSAMIDNPMPDNSLARNLYAAGDFAGQALITKGALDRAPPSAVSRGPSLPTEAPSTLRSNLSTARNAAQAGASGFAGNAVADITGNPALGVLASFGPNVADAGAPALRAMGGAGSDAGRQRIAQRVQDFKGAGVDAGIGLVTDSPVTGWLNNIAANTPGGSYYMDQAARNIQTQMGGRVGGIVNDLSPNAVGPRAAGNQVTQATQDYRTRQQDIYSRLDERANERMDPSARVPIANFQQRFEQKFAPIPGAPGTSEALTGPLRGAYKLGGALIDDANGGAGPSAQLGGQSLSVMQTPDGRWIPTPQGAQAPQSAGVPYTALSAIKGRMGDLAYPSNPLLTDANQGALKYLYGGLKADQQAAALNAGPAAAAARDRATDFYAGTQRKLQDVLAPLAKGGDITPGDVYDRLASMTKDQGSELARAWVSIPAAARKTVTATVVDHLGRATPGQQNAAGDAFSSRQFLTNWNRVTPEAKDVLFRGFPEGPAMRSKLDAVAQAADVIDQSTKSYVNPSKTGKATAAAALGGSALAGLLGHPVAGLYGIGAVGGSAITAKMLTNPRFVNWLAITPKLPAARLTAQLTALSGWMRMEKDPQLKRDVQDFVRRVQGTQDLGQGVSPMSAR